MQGERLIEGTGSPSFYAERLTHTLFATGSMGTLFIVLAVTLVLLLRQPQRERTYVSWLAAYLGIFVFFLISGSVPRYITGDEPHYLVIAQSLATDQDVDLADDYAEVPEISPHYAGVDHSTRSVHNMGVGILLAIPWSIAGGRGAIIAMNAFAVLLVWAFDRFLETCDVSRHVRVIGLLSFAACLPMLAFASQIYPEVPGALALTLVLTEILRSSSRSCHLCVIVAGIIMLPWLHVRYLPYAVFLAALRRQPGSGVLPPKPSLSVNSILRPGGSG